MTVLTDAIWVKLPRMETSSGDWGMTKKCTLSSYTITQKPNKTKMSRKQSFDQLVKLLSQKWLERLYQHQEIIHSKPPVRQFTITCAVKYNTELYWIILNSSWGPLLNLLNSASRTLVCWQHSASRTLVCWQHSDLQQCSSHWYSCNPASCRVYWTHCPQHAGIENAQSPYVDSLVRGTSQCKYL